MKDCGAHLVYHVNDGLSCIPAKPSENYNLLLSGEDFLDQRDEFVRRVCPVD